MKRNILRSFVFLLCAIPALAQEKPVSNDSEQKLHEVLKASLDALRKRDGYSLTVQTQWKSEGQGSERNGSNHYLFQRAKAGPFRIEVRPGESKTPELVCVSDGKTLTRLLPTKNWYSQETTTDPIAEVRQCALTILSLEGSGIDLLLRPDLPEHVRAQATRIHYSGVETVGREKMHRFQCVWAGNRDLELWFSADAAPLPRRVTRSVTFPLADKKTVKLTTDSTLTWTFDLPIPATAFDTTPPKNARRVEDLHTAMINGITDSFLGKPAPAFAVMNLDGKTVTISPADEKKVVALRFWATWNAASAEEAPAIAKMVGDLKKRGVAFYAVNVGEKLPDVKAFLSKRSVESTVVLDLDGKVTEAYGVTAIPVTVLIGKDGTVQAVLRGSKPSTREQFVQDVEALLEGKSLATPSR